jgi:hypothetical protein
MSEWHKKLDVRNPERRVGTTADGQPIWMDLRELIASPAENEERMSTTYDFRVKAEIDKAARIVLRNAAIFIEQTFNNITPKSVMDSSNPGSFLEYAHKQGFAAVQDGLKTVCKVGGKVIREMDANVPPKWAESIARKVNEFVKEIKA